MHRSAIRACLAALTVSGLHAVALGQSSVPNKTTPDIQPMTVTGVPGWMVVEVQDPNSPAMIEYRSRMAELHKVRQELRRLRHTHLSERRPVERQQLGLEKLRAYRDPATIPVMIEVFEKDGPEIRGRILDHIASLELPESDTALAHQAIFGKDRAQRAMALDRLAGRVEAVDGSVPSLIPMVAGGLESGDDEAVTAASIVASRFRIEEVIPQLITAQVATNTGRAPRTGDLAWIMVATQQAFIADLQPVVADGAVGFDPQLGVVSEGTLLRVQDAAVTVYRTEVFNNLVTMTSDLWGQSTSHLGMDPKAWRKWYEEQFIPSRVPDDLTVDPSSPADGP